jgi:ABC-type nitrate/sulfonate/bicarbonate transport system substrate-binding protein
MEVGMKRSILLTILTAALVLTGCSGGTAAPATLPHVTLVLDWVPNTNHTGFFVALDKGWYKDQGLDVEIQTPSDPAAGLKQVAFGHSELGISFEEEVTIARAQGIPVVSIGAILQHNTSAFASLQSSGITRPKDWEGHRYASTGVPLERALVEGIMKCDGGDVSKVEFVDVGFDVLPAIIAGNADIGLIYTGWEGIQAQNQGTELRLIPLQGSCIPDEYTPLVIAGESTISGQSDMLRKFMAATSKGFDYAIAHPAESADILLKHAEGTDAELVRQSQAYLSPRYQADASRWGQQTLATWTAFGKWMADNRLIEGTFDPGKAFTNDFLP